MVQRRRHRSESYCQIPRQRSDRVWDFVSPLFSTPLYSKAPVLSPSSISPYAEEETRQGDLGVKQPQSPTTMPTAALKDILPNDPLPPPDQRRLKIEYVPVSRPLDTIGGRRLEAIEQHLAILQQRRVVRHHDELGECPR